MIVQISAGEWRVLRDGKFMPNTFTSRLSVHSFLQNEIKRVCSKGHALTPENIYRYSDGRFYCKKCNNDSSKAYWHNKRAKAHAAAIFGSKND